jgi:hypothetical protein
MDYTYESRYGNMKIIENSNTLGRRVHIVIGL